MIALEAGDWRLTILPEVGGSIARLTWRGEDVMRPTPDGATDPLQTACFPLVPYANRIAEARFSFGGRDVTLSATPGFEPNTLHGDGWRSPWTVESVGGRSAVLTLDHAAGEWPWTWRARQVFELDEAGLSVTLELVNRSDEIMPAGVGLHPYFEAASDTTLTLKADRVWTVDGRLIPDRLVEAAEIVDWSDGRAVRGAPFVDNFYAGWDSAAVLTGGGRRTTLSATGARGAHVYVPTGETYCCVEPVSHRPDGLNAPAGEDAGVAALQPGGTLSLSMRLETTGA